MKRFFLNLSVGLLLLASLFFTKTIFAASTQTVIVGTSGQTKPLDYFDEKENLTGLEIDILKAIEKNDPSLHFEFQTAEFASLFAGLDAKKFDLLINNLGESGDRRQKYLFSKYPYVITHNVLITKNPNEKDLTLEDLAGKNFGVVAASPQSLFLETWNKEHPDKKVNLQYVDSDPSQIIQGVYSGKFDATIYATTYLKDVEKTFGIHLKASPIKNEDVIRPPGSYFIFRKDNLKLRNQIDQSLETLRQNGTLKAISEKYLGQDDTVLTPAIKEKNDALEEKLLATTEENKVVATSNSQEGKIFVPKEIPHIFKRLLPKLPVTILMTVVSGAIGVILGLLIALVKIKKVPVLTPLFNLFVSFMRGTPQLVQLFLAYYGLPLIFQWWQEKFGLGWTFQDVPALIYVFVALGLNEAAYTSETFRSAIEAVDVKEIEAAKAIGLTSFQTLRRIILPNALIVALPNLGNSFISLLKGTSLAFTVTVIDIMGQARIIAGANLRFFEAYIAVALLYWILCIAIEQGIKKLERHFNVTYEK